MSPIARLLTLLLGFICVTCISPVSCRTGNYHQFPKFHKTFASLLLCVPALSFCVLKIFAPFSVYIWCIFSAFFSSPNAQPLIPPALQRNTQYATRHAHPRNAQPRLPSSYSVSTTGCPLVMITVCSNCAARARSVVRSDQPSASSLTRPRPVVRNGSIASTSPSFKTRLSSGL